MLEIACEPLVIPSIQLKIKVPSEVFPTAAGSILHAQHQATNNQHFDTRSLSFPFFFHSWSFLF